MSNPNMVSQLDRPEAEINEIDFKVEHVRLGSPEITNQRAPEQAGRRQVETIYAQPETPADDFSFETSQPADTEALQAEAERVHQEICDKLADRALALMNNVDQVEPGYTDRLWSEICHLSDKRSQLEQGVWPGGMEEAGGPAQDKKEAEPGTEHTQRITPDNTAEKSVDTETGSTTLGAAENLDEPTWGKLIRSQLSGQLQQLKAKSSEALEDIQDKLSDVPEKLQSSVEARRSQLESQVDKAEIEFQTLQPKAQSQLQSLRERWTLARGKVVEKATDWQQALLEKQQEYEARLKAHNLTAKKAGAIAVSTMLILEGTTELMPQYEYKSQLTAEQTSAEPLPKAEVEPETEALEANNRARSGNNKEGGAEQARAEQDPPEEPLSPKFQKELEKAKAKVVRKVNNLNPTQVMFKSLLDDELGPADFNQPHIFESFQQAAQKGEAGTYNVEGSKVPVNEALANVLFVLKANGFDFTVNSLTTGDRTNSSSNHYDGEAVDLKIVDQGGNLDVEATQEMAAFLYHQNEKGKLDLNELIFSPMSGGHHNLYDGRQNGYGPNALDSHTSHIHVSVQPEARVSEAVLQSHRQKLIQRGQERAEKHVRAHFEKHRRQERRQELREKRKQRQQNEELQKERRRRRHKQEQARKRQAREAAKNQKAQNVESEQSRGASPDVSRTRGPAYQEVIRRHRTSFRINSAEEARRQIANQSQRKRTEQSENLVQSIKQRGLEDLLGATAFSLLANQPSDSEIIKLEEDAGDWFSPTSFKEGEVVQLNSFLPIFGFGNNQTKENSAKPTSEQKTESSAQAEAEQKPEGSIHEQDLDNEEYFEALRECEASGDYTKNTGNGYFGAYQFDRNTWDTTAKKSGHAELVGVRPDLASPAAQDHMARKLYEFRSGKPWPNCP